MQLPADGVQNVPQYAEASRILDPSLRRSSNFQHTRIQIVQIEEFNAKMRIRTDLAVTLFLSEPEEYDGGELVVEDYYGSHEVKLPAGHLVLYPATSLHQVTPITRGVRTSCFFWVQSLIRDDQQRALLYEMDGAIQRLNQTNADETARRSLIGCYHNLVRQWSET